jgi:hypothetical protein
VNYGSPEPITQTLRTFAIDLTASPSLAQIFQQLRGQRVELETPGPITGTIVGTEIRKLPAGGEEGNGIVETEVLNLRTEGGLQSVRIDRIEQTRLLDEKVDREFQQALDLLASAHANERKSVKLDFRGAGKRNVSVGYIQEAPIWKTTYRLVLKDDQPPFLQGWAIVENTTPQDWRDVQLTLVSGRPVSFVMDLYQPMFMARPFVTPDNHASVRPRTYDQDLAGVEQEFREARNRTAERRGRSGGMGGMGMGGGMGGGFFGGPPAVTSVVPVTDEDDKSGFDLSKGVASAASGQDVGELFRYVIQTPVSIDRSESAMLPIVNQAVKAEKLAIYNPAVHAKHPLAGLRLTNNTELHLLQGPITLYDGGEYAGDARIEDIPPGSSRLVTYALDLETEVAVEDKPSEQVTTGLRIVKGGLHVKHRMTRTQQYVVKNSSDEAKPILLERPIDGDWKVLEPKPDETTRSLYRFKTTAEPGKPQTVAITEQRELGEDFVIATLDLDRLKFFLHVPAASAELKKTLEEVISRKTALAEIVAKRSALESRIQALTEDQDRVRKNLQAIPLLRSNMVPEANIKASGALLERYLKKLSEGETELETLRTQLNTLLEAEAKANHDLQTYLSNLTVD